MYQELLRSVKAKDAVATKTALEQLILAERLFDINQIIDSTDSLLSIAIKNDDLATVQALLHHPQITVIYDEAHKKISPIELAVETGNTEILTVIIQHAITKNENALLNRDIIHQVMLLAKKHPEKKDACEASAVLLAKIPQNHINAVNRDGDTPLHLAVSAKMYALTEALINRKDIRINSINNSNCTPLMACMPWSEEDLRVENIPIEFLELFLKHEARLDLNLVDNKGETALFYAVHSKDTEKLRKFLEFKSNLLNFSICNNKGFPALYYVGRTNIPELIYMFINDRRADLNIKTADKKHYVVHFLFTQNNPINNICMSLFITAQHPHAARTPDGKEVPHYKFDVELKDSEGGNRTLLALAVEKNNVEITELLLKTREKINVNCVDTASYTPIFTAIKNENVKIVQLILDHGRIKIKHKIPGTSTLDGVTEKINLDIYDLAHEAKNKEIFKIVRAYYVKVGILSKYPCNVM